MKSTFQEEYERIITATKKVKESLTGEGEEVCLDQEPFRRYSVGIITPLSQNELSLDEEKQKRILKRRPNSIGFEARVTPNTSTFTIKVSFDFSVYYRCFPSYEEQKESRNIKEDSESLAQNNTAIYFRQ